MLATVNTHRPYPASLGALFASLWGHRQLILQLTKREVLSRYRGSIMGLAWSFFNPLLMLFVYTFVFSVVFKARWGGDTGESNAGFAIIVFSGLIIHGLFADCLNRAPSLIVANPNYVKKVVFPLDVLPWVTMGSALFHAGISLVVLLAAQLAWNHALHWTVLFLPVIILPLVLATMGLCWILASLGVYLRDVGQTIGIVTTVMLFLSPVLYPITAVPEALRPVLWVNPLTFVIEQARRVAIWGDPPGWTGWLAYLAASIFVAQIGFWWFQRTRRGFADVV